jgi:hypothetical protein
LIDYELLYIEGVRRGLGPGDEELDAAIEFNRENVSPEAVEQAVAYSRKLGEDVTVEEYWDHPSVREALKKALTVGKTRSLLEGEDPAPRDGSLAEEVKSLRAAADIRLDEQVIARSR